MVSKNIIYIQLGHVMCLYVFIYCYYKINIVFLVLFFKFLKIHMIYSEVNLGLKSLAYSP